MTTGVEVTLDVVSSGAGSVVGTGSDGTGGESYTVRKEISQSPNNGDPLERTNSGYSERS